MFNVLTLCLCVFVVVALQVELMHQVALQWSR